MSCVVLTTFGAIPSDDEWASPSLPLDSTAAAKGEVRTAEDPQPDPKAPGIDFEFPIRVGGDDNQPLREAVISIHLPGDDALHAVRRKTDEQGRYLLRGRYSPPAESGPTQSALLMIIRHPDYAPKQLIMVGTTTATFTGKKPDRTVRLDRGVAIAGKVIAAGGGPVAAVKISLEGTDIPQEVYSRPSGAWSEHASVHFSGEDSVTTDAEGIWRIPHFPTNRIPILIQCVGADGSEAQYGIMPERLGIPAKPLDAEKLFESKAVLELTGGSVVRGVVTDTAGAPIPEADVWENFGFQQSRPPVHFRTDANGRFKRVNRVKRQWVYSASAPGKATSSAIIAAGSDNAPVRLVLSPAKPLKIKLVDRAQKPMAKTVLSAPVWKNQGQALVWNPTTDDDGTAVWTNRPLNKVVLVVNQPTGARFIAIDTNETEKTVVLKPLSETQMTVAVHATDIATGAEVKISKIDLIVQPWMPARSLGTPQDSKEKVAITQAQLQGQEAFALRIAADGYTTFSMSSITFDDGELSIEAKLKKATNLTVKVLNPDGSPAASVRCWVKTGSQPQQLYINPEQIWGEENFTKVVTDATGQAVLPDGADDGGVIAYSATGIASSTLGDLRKTPELKLIALGAVEGELKGALGNAPNGLQLALTETRWNSERPYQLGLNAQIDGKNHFRFKSVPPGEYYLVKYHSRMGMLTPSHPQAVKVKPGETNHFDYGGNGRSIAGEATSDPEDAAVDWKNDSHKLEFRPEANATPNPQPNPSDYATVDAWQAAIKVFGSANMNGSAARTYMLDFEDDGSFHTDDVPPGKYFLNITVTKPQKGRQNYSFNRPEDQLGTLQKEVVIPEGTGVFNLGSVSVPIKGEGPGKASGPLELSTVDLEGNPWNLASLKGKVVVLGVWTTWSQRSQDFFKEWSALVAEYGKDKEVVFVGVDVGEDAPTVTKAVKDRGYGWQQVSVSGKAATQFLDRLGITEVPYCFVITREGKAKT
ncbi:MAG TPA: thioredoxin-like domain-containing protein, partial [Candidatus Limnocylindria bacterium]|nr:thioredoxin-like domain-containing protein [Candidatus Limnocylindria bacterium]